MQKKLENYQNKIKELRKEIIVLNKEISRLNNQINIDYLPMIKQQGLKIAAHKLNIKYFCDIH
jgi:peptidoglycan hydrolase CwlO-like protein